jgi:hypothetical protein
LQVVPTRWYWITASDTKPPFLGHCLREKGYLTGGKRQAVVRCHNQSGLPQHSIRCTQINHGLRLGPQGGSKSTPRAGIAMRPKLARSCWSDTMMGNSLRKTGTERETGQAAQGNMFLASPQQGVSPSRSIQQSARHSWPHLRHAPVGLVLKSY